MENKKKQRLILVADDDRNVHSSLNAYFRKEGFSILSAFDGYEAIRLAQESQPDLMLLDVMMPGADGFTVCREVRTSCALPIIILSAKGEEFDRLIGLELGADDYISKPFSPREVIARIHAVLRRSSESHVPNTSTRLSIANLEIDRASFIVKLDGEVIPCTSKELDILWILAGNPGNVFSRDLLLQKIWGYDFFGDTRAVDSHIKRIRAKLCRPGNPWDIKTVWGIGYRLEVTD